MGARTQTSSSSVTRNSQSQRAIADTTRIRKVCDVRALLTLWSCFSGLPAASSKPTSDLPEGEKDGHLAWQVKLHLVSPGRGPGLIISPAELGSEFPGITMNCDNSLRIYPSNRLKESRKVSVIRERECGINTKAGGSVFV